MKFIAGQFYQHNNPNRRVKLASPYLGPGGMVLVETDDGSQEYVPIGELSEWVPQGKSATPRTDIFREKIDLMRPDGTHRIDALADFARQLERELAEAREAFSAQVEAWYEVTKQRDTLKATNDKIHGWLDDAEQAAGRLNNQVNTLRRELAEATKQRDAARIPICIGRPIIEILAKEGMWVSMDGNSVVAADCLFGKNPYQENADVMARPDGGPNT